MDARRIFEDLLSSGQQLARQGQQYLEKSLGVPADGPERDRALGNLGKGAAVGGVLALLLGTRAGRRVAGPLLKIGGAAALGALGYAAYKKWQNQPGGSQAWGTPVNELQGDAAQQRSRLLLQAMIAAANADDHIDPSERQAIIARVQQLGLDPAEQQSWQTEIDQPLSVEELARGVDSLSTASEVYLTSLLIIDAEHPVERAYLQRLAAALKLPWDLVQQLEAEASAVG